MQGRIETSGTGDRHSRTRDRLSTHRVIDHTHRIERQTLLGNALARCKREPHERAATRVGTARIARADGAGD